MVGGLDGTLLLTFGLAALNAVSLVKNLDI